MNVHPDDKYLGFQDKARNTSYRNTDGMLAVIFAKVRAEKSEDVDAINKLNRAWAKGIETHEILCQIYRDPDNRAILSCWPDPELDVFRR